MKRIFRQQKALMEKYHPIEASNCSIYDYYDSSTPVSMDTIGGQARIKHLAWYTIEELAEMLETPHVELRHEEFSDAFHFFVELCITAGYDYYFFDPLDLYFGRLARSPHKHDTRTSHAVTRYVHAIGMAMNQLKNKPWKRTRTQFTNTEYQTKFEAYLSLAMFHLIEVAWTIGISSPERLVEVYMSKSEINKKRQGSGY